MLLLVVLVNYKPQASRLTPECVCLLQSFQVSNLTRRCCSDWVQLRYQP
jgi:hypothetical protein